jgi:asparagine synthase (glutamine-hydrolysing)
MRTLLPDYILSAQGERMLMAHSVEARIPFLDNEVVDVALRLGEEDKVFGASEKDVLRRAVAGIVPDSIRLRPKQAYRAPVAATLRSPTGEELTDLLGPDGDDGVFVRRKVERLATRLRAGKEISGTQEMALAGVLTTRLWMQIVAGWRREREELYA